MKDLCLFVVSDVYDWDLIIEEFSKIEKNPRVGKIDLVICNGDLIEDGNTKYHFKGLFDIVNFVKEFTIIKEKYGIIFDEKKENSFLGIQFQKSEDRNKYWKIAQEEISNLEEKYLFSEEYYNNWRTNYVEKFYRFLELASKKAKVFVIQGNHDEYKEYNIKRINSIPNCEEISGKCVKFNKYTFLGLNYWDSHYLNKLNPIIYKFKNKVDFLITHNEHRRDEVLLEFNPKQFIIKGHSCHNLQKIKNVLFVPSDKGEFTIIKYVDEIRFNVYTYEKADNSNSSYNLNWIFYRDLTKSKIIRDNFK
ncbi:MAG: hypothetical protein ACOCXG_03810 [Nanoarchaeota archaeon]